MRESTPLVTFSISSERSPYYKGEQITLTAAASSMPTPSSYEIQDTAYGAVNSTNGMTDSDLGFSSTCSNARESEDVTSGAASHFTTFTCHARDFRNNGSGFGGGPYITAVL